MKNENDEPKNKRPAKAGRLNVACCQDQLTLTALQARATALYCAEPEP
jgi:hypothetical protein